MVWVSKMYKNVTKNNKYYFWQISERNVYQVKWGCKLLDFMKNS